MDPQTKTVIQFHLGEINKYLQPDQVATLIIMSPGKTIVLPDNIEMKENG